MRWVMVLRLMKERVVFNRKKKNKNNSIAKYELVDICLNFKLILLININH